MNMRLLLPEFAKRPYRRIRAALRSLLRPRTVACHVRGLEIRIGVSSEMEEFRADTYATKEPETLEWLDTRLRPGDVFIDVGANIGLYSLYAAKRAPSSRVFAIEPEAQNFASLCSNVVLNNASNVTPCNVPLNDHEEFDFLYVSDRTAGSAFHSFGRAPASDKSPIVRQAALGLPLDALVAKYGFPSPQLIKIDVDGQEERILVGAERVLEDPTCRGVLVEFNFRDEKDLQRMMRRLQASGFLLVRRSGWVAQNHDLSSQNFIFEKAAT